MFKHVLGILLILAAIPAAASDSDALAISANIQARHLPFGTILDPVYAGAGSDQIVGYTRCGDSAIWTGHYLAAEAFRYKVTADAQALANARSALAGLQSLVDITGRDLLARCIMPAGSLFAPGITQEEAHNGIHTGVLNGQSFFWIGNTSRDQYSGVFFGLGVAYDLVDDAAMRASIKALVTRMLNFLLRHGWNVVMPDGSISTTFLVRADQQLSFLQLGRHVNSGSFGSKYSWSAFFSALGVPPPIGIDVGDIHDSYFKFNLDTINLYNLIRWENNSIRRDIYRQAYDILRHTTDDHGNAHFNMIDRALNGPNSNRDHETVALLEAWLERPKRDVTVDLQGVVPVCGSYACQPIPVNQRVPTDFLWQRDPFQLSGGGSGVIESAGIDYILPYWMARYYGVL